MSAARRVPFNRAYTTGAEFDYIREAIEATELSGNGPFSGRCNAWLEHHIGVARSLLTHSATAALEMAVLLADVGVGDEVIMPSYTFVSTANAVALRGAVPVFVDIRPDTLNIDESLIEDAVTPRTRAIIVVHYAGVACAMDEILSLADRHELILIEDAAQGIMSTYHGRALGGIAHLGALSFHETKNVMCGEGGALLINDRRWVERAEVIHEKGTNRRKFFRGQVDKYTWVDIGSSYPLSDISAAFLWAQLQDATAITNRRLAVWDAYHAAFAPLASDELVKRPTVPEGCRHNAHMYYLLLDSRDRFMEALNASGVHAVFHYVPLHSSDAGRRLGRVHGDLSQTERVSDALVRLPLWAAMDEDDVEQVIGAVFSAIATTAKSLK